MSQITQIQSIPRENEQHKDMMQNGFFIELKQNPYTTKVTTLPPSFDWNEKCILGSLLYYKCKNEIWKW
jgi:hypothetical protein